MSNKTFTLSASLYKYLLDNSLREPALLRRLREETARQPQSAMQIAPEQGQFMQLLVRLLAPRRAIEIGTFTGYSSLCVALAMPPEGRLIACDVSEESAAVARRYWKAAGVEERISLRLGPALATLDTLIKEGRAGTFDFVFIDADKENYRNYYERSLTLLRAGGLIAVDNTLWNGAVADRRKKDADTEAIRRFNRHLHADGRIFLSLVPIGDGLTLAIKTS